MPLDTEGTVTLTLIETTDLTGEAFSLVFLGPPGWILPQRTYDFEHDGLGRFPLFVTAIGMQEDGVRYEAVFNRLPRPSRPTP